MKEEGIKEALRAGYVKVARQSASRCSSIFYGTTKPQEISRKIVYTKEDMQEVPEGRIWDLAAGIPRLWRQSNLLRPSWIWDLEQVLIASWVPRVGTQVKP